MPLKINVGLSQKIGLPDYGSLGASCHVEFEADGQLLQHDLDGFQRQVADAFVACKQAVQDELHRHQRPASSANGNGNGHAHRGNGSANGRSTTRKATASQVRAIHTIAERLQVDLTTWLQEKFGLRMPDQLSVPQASTVIDQLKALPSGNGGGAY